MKIIALCHTCQRKHTMDFDPVVGPGSGFSDWLTKHPNHDTRFVFPQRSQKTDPDRLHRKRITSKEWMHYVHNADVKSAYGSSVAWADSGLNSLAASSSLLAGYELVAVDNGASNKYLDFYIAGNFSTAAANGQVGSINVAVVGAINDTPTWPTPFDGTASAETVGLQSIYDQCCKIAAQITTIATDSQVYFFGPTTIAGLFGGVVPDQFVGFVSHNAETSTNAWLNSGQLVSYTPIYATVS